jgi:hypothetical protein
MQSLDDYIVRPKGQRYNNAIDVGDKKLIINTEVFNHQFVNREAEVIAIPRNNKANIKVGDTIVLHHNVFRRWHNIKGEEKNSRSYFKENTYFIKEDQIFAFKRNNKWKPMKGYCFIKPIKNKDIFSSDKEQPLIGIVKQSDGTVEVGDLVGFRPNSEYEFVIDGERLYRVLSSFITIKYEYQGDEEEYNPSWA